MTIWKFELELRQSQVVEMPADARILDVQVQGGALYLWALVDPRRDREERRVEIVGTGTPAGHVLGEQLDYVATVQVESFVWHVFASGSPRWANGGSV